MFVSYFPAGVNVPMLTVKWVSSDRACGTSAPEMNKTRVLKMEGGDGQGVSNSDMAGLRRRGLFEQNVCDEASM